MYHVKRAYCLMHVQPYICYNISGQYVIATGCYHILDNFIFTVTLIQNYSEIYLVYGVCSNLFIYFFFWRKQICEDVLKNKSKIIYELCNLNGII